MDFKFVDANSIKSKFAAKSAKKEKTVEDVRASIAKTLLKMIDGTKKNKMAGWFPASTKLPTVPEKMSNIPSRKDANFSILR